MLVFLELKSETFPISTSISFLSDENELHTKSSNQMKDSTKKLNKTTNHASKAESHANPQSSLEKESISSRKDSLSESQYNAINSNQVGEFESSYGERLRSLIQQNLNYPEMAKIRGLEGTVEMEITISSNGDLISAVIVKTSGHPLLDQSAIKTAKKISHFEKFEENFIAKQWRFKLPIAFVLD